MRNCWFFPFVALLALLPGCSSGSQQSRLSAILAGIQITGQSANLVVGQSQQMTAIGVYADKSQQDLTNAVSWSSSNTSVASISSGGMVTATNSGQTAITATSHGVTGSFNLTVAPALVSIAVTPVNPTNARQTTLQFTATGTYTDKSSQNLTASVTWSSSVTSVATISTAAPTNGLASAVSAGTTTITASLGNVSGSTILTVSTASVSSLTVTPANPTLPLGLSQQFTANAGFSDGSNQDVTDVTQWQSSATGVASITNSGLATAINIGTSTISGTFGGMTATSLLTVNAANLKSITIGPANPTMAPGTNLQLAAKGSFNDGSTRDVTFLASWTSSTPSVASVGSGSALASALTQGMTTITATLGGISGSTSLTVSNATITSVLISPSSPKIPIGAAQSFTATGVFSDSSTQDITRSVVWSSSNTAIATIASTAPTAVGVSAGTTNINATFSFGSTSQAGTTVLTVSSATLASLAITPSSAEIAPASSQEFLATGTFSDGSTQDMNTLVTWSTSDTHVAVVSHPGVITGEAAGVVTVTAQQGSVSASANLLVESATLSSIQVTPQQSSVATGYETAFKALGSFSNGDTQDLTAFVTWTSSNSSVATISNAQSTPGFGTGVQPGTKTISALFAGQSAHATLTVTNATLISITVSPSNPSISVGQTQQFSATGSFSDGSSSNLVAQVAWSSSDPAVATISTQGVASALSSGTSTISAELNGVKGTAILTAQ